MISRGINKEAVHDLISDLSIHLLGTVIAAILSVFFFGGEFAVPDEHSKGEQVVISVIDLYQTQLTGKSERLETLMSESELDGWDVLIKDTKIHIPPEITMRYTAGLLSGIVSCIAFACIGRGVFKLFKIAAKFIASLFVSGVFLPFLFIIGAGMFVFYCMALAGLFPLFFAAEIIRDIVCIFR